MARKPKTGLLLVSLTLVPSIPVVYAKSIEPVNLQPPIVDEEDAKADAGIANDDEFNSEHAGERSDENSPQMTLEEWWSLIKPQFSYLLLSVLGSFAIAFLNIKIPICLGDLVNELSRFVNTTEFDPNKFLSAIKEPALRLVWAYLLQGAATTITIQSLSVLGERMAADLRDRLFRSIINQDIEFFDRRRTGEILNVLAADVQEFKSSFKTFFSQGLRSFTQVIGE